MNLWIVLAGLAVVILLFVAVRIRTFAHWRRPKKVTCPRTGTEAQIAGAPAGGAIAAIVGGAFRVDRCSLWSDEARLCGEPCLKLPGATDRPVPLSAPSR